MSRVQRAVTVITLIAAGGLSPSTAIAAAHPAQARFHTDLVRAVGHRAAITATGYGPSDLQSAYGLTSAAANDGKGQRVYIGVAYDDPSIASDLATYRSNYNLPACTEDTGCLQVLNQEGNASPLPTADPSGGWEAEEALQADMVSAICPNCGITVMEADDDIGDGLYVEVKTATDIGAKFVSLPWGGPEQGDAVAEDSDYFASSGVVYAAEAGADDYQPYADYPASSDDVVAVGGTTLSTADNSRGWQETAWKDTSSGCSKQEARPSWQSGIVSTGCTYRITNDISADADPNTGVETFSSYPSGTWTPVGGNSVAAPIIAAAFALAGTPAPGEHPAQLLYQREADLNDVTSGEETGCPGTVICQAATGWDGPTGLGTPNGLAAFLPPTDASAFSVGHGTSIRAGRSTTVRSTLTDSASHEPIAHTAVTLLSKPAGARSFSRVTSVASGTSGGVSLSVSPTTTTSYEWSYAGDHTHHSATSTPTTVSVASALSLKTSARHVKKGKRFALFGTVTPPHAGEKVTIQRKSGRSWKQVTTTKVRNLKLPGGKKKRLGFEVKIHAHGHGKQHYRAVVAKSATNAAGTSSVVTVKIS